MVGESSLSARSPTPENDHRPRPNQDDENLKHASKATATAHQTRRELRHSKGLEIKVPSAGSPSSTTAFIHTPQNYYREQAEGREKTATILVSSSEGGVLGPSSISLSLADKARESQPRHHPSLRRLDHRFPAPNYPLRRGRSGGDEGPPEQGYAVARFVLVGWGASEARRSSRPLRKIRGLSAVRL